SSTLSNSCFSSASDRPSMSGGATTVSLNRVARRRGKKNLTACPFFCPYCRAGDVTHLHWRDIDWQQATVQVAGKSQRAVRLPLSQEVGDALLVHLANAPSAVPSDPIFLNSVPPLGRSFGHNGVSRIAARAMLRAGVSAPTRGAHVFR